MFLSNNLSLNRIARTLFAALFFTMILHPKIGNSQEISGAWQFLKRDGNCVAFSLSKDLQSTYIVYTVEGLGEMMKIHWLEADSIEKFNGQVVFEFDNGSRHGLKISTEKRKGELGFEAKVIPESLLPDLKKTNSFSVKFEDALVAGPFSLKGSTNVLNKIEDC